MNDILFKIERNIWESIANESRIGIMDGLSGIALFYNSLYEVFGNEDYKDKLLFIIDKANKIITEEDISFNLCSGLAGYGLMLLRVQNNFIEVDEDYFASIDLLLQEELNKQTSLNKYDYLHGSMGIAKYFIERYKTTDNHLVIEVLDKFSRELIEKINTNFEDVLIEPVFFDKTCYYFGLAHGAAGYLNFLIYLKRNFTGMKHDIKEPLNVISRFLNNYKGKNIDSNQFYPNLFILETKTRINPILGWCQGDLGISIALLNLGLYLNEPNVNNEALELINNIEQITIDDSGVMDFAMCHGSLGIILQFHLISIISEMDSANSINKWYDVLEQQTKKFTEFFTFHNGKYQKETNLLDGIAGLGMGILTLKKKISYQWLDIFNLY